MDFMDLLLAEALAHGMARQAAEARQSRPPPDNYFVLPSDPQAWRKLYSACKEEHMVICIEVTDDSHPGSRRCQPLVVELAREVSQIPFFQVKIGFGRTYDELRRDLRGIRFTPTIIIVFFDDGDVCTTKIEGEEDIRFAIRTGAIDRAIKQYVDQRMKLKVAERLAEELFKGAVASEMERRKRQAALEYEKKLQREKELMEAREMERQKQKMEEEKRQKLEAERKDAEELERRKRALEDKRRGVEDELLTMDLMSCKIREIKEKMEEAGISHVGATSRDELLSKLKNRFPRLKAKLETSSNQPAPTGNLSSYTTSRRQPLFDEVDGGLSYGNSGGGSNEVTRLRQKVQQLEGNVEELEKWRERLTDEKDTLQRILKDKESEITRKNKELADMRSNQSSQQQRRFSNDLFGSGSSSSSSRVQELEKELTETRLLYSCTLDDMDILGVIARGDERGQGTVVRVQCNKPEMTNTHVFAMKVISGVLETTTFSQVRNNSKIEYEVLSSIPQHKNIIKLFAFFYDRPKAHPKLSKYCGEGMALCMLMEQLSQNMEQHMAVLRRGNGPMASKAISWLKDIVDGSCFLFSHNVVHRDMKLENLLISGDSIKIADFGSAIRLDATMKLPFTFASPRGGNEAHLAPEVLNTRAAPGKVLNYQKQPVWEAGVLAYELAGYGSPFERVSVDQRSYSVSSIARLTSTHSQNLSRQQAFPPNFTNLVQLMLEFDPDDRPTINEVQRKLSSITV